MLVFMSWNHLRKIGNSKIGGVRMYNTSFLLHEFDVWKPKTVKVILFGLMNSIFGDIGTVQ
jgi:hypothetical protein